MEVIMQKMQLSPEWRQWASWIFEELQLPVNWLQSLPNMYRHLSYDGYCSPAKMVLKVESQWCELQTVTAPKATAEILFNCSILSSQRP